MTQNPVKDIAIIVPAYNASGTVRETLESIQNQQSGLDRCACIVVADDHSTDETSAVAQSCWACNVPLTVSRNEKNWGERTTTNAAVCALPDTVQWFFLLHADDVAKPNWLEVLLRGIDQAQSRTIAFTASYDVLYADGKVVPGENFGEGRKINIEGTPSNVLGTLKKGCWFKISSSAIRVSAFRALGGFVPDMPQLGDWEFVLRSLREGWTIEYIPLCLSFYRQSLRSVGSQSIRAHRDVKESLVILERFGEFLSPRDMAGFHVLYLYWLARRAVASVIRGDFERLKMAGIQALGVAGSLRRNCFGRRSAAKA